MPERIHISKKRLGVHILIIMFIGLSFWAFSRYPELLYEAKRAQQGTLLERNVGSITKDEIVEIDAQKPESTFVVIGKTTLDWIYANRVGMSFGIILGGALLALLTPLMALRRYFSVRGLGGSLIGIFIGAPMGICANCVAPVGVAMKKRGVSLETTLSAMFASPTLNIVALSIVFTVFPFELAVTKVIATLFLIFLVIPFVVRFLTQKSNVSFLVLKGKTQWEQESLFFALRAGITSFVYQTARLAVLVVPLMLLAGVLGATIITLFPLENFIDPTQNQFLLIGAAALIGTALPIPMLVDLILVLALLQAGLSLGVAAALLITLPAYSIFSTFVIGKYFSKKLAIILFMAVVGTGIAGGTFILVVEGTLISNSTPTFVNVIKDSGIKKGGESTGVAWADYNNDGYLDLLMLGGRDGNKLYRNNKDGTFTDVTKEAGMTPTAIIGLAPISWAGSFADYDNNGCIDFYVSNRVDNRSDTLYRNNCDGTFTDVSSAAGIEDTYRGTGIAWADYNNDGYVDIYVANYGERIAFETYISEPNILYRNNGDGTFTDTTEESGVMGIADCSGFTPGEGLDFTVRNGPWKIAFQPIWFDYNNDRRPDLFIATDASISPLYRNNGDGTFTDVTQEAGLCLKGTGMGVTVGDYDNDGDLDLYVTNTGPNYFWENNGDDTFTEVAQRTGTADSSSLGWAVGFLDYDNDGNLDLYDINGSVTVEARPAGLSGGVPSRRTIAFQMNVTDKLYKNTGEGVFTEVSLQEGIYGSDAKEGAAFADYNNDGFIDVIVVSSHLEEKSSHRLYQNQGNSNNWLTVQLVGTKSNRDGIGARITITTGEKYQIREIINGSSFLSQNSLWQTFGLGISSRADVVKVEWPSGAIQTLFNVQLNQKIIIVEKNDTF